MQQFAWSLTATLIIIVIAVFSIVAFKSRDNKEYDPIMKKAYRFRTVWFITLLIAFMISFIFTLSDLPYNKGTSAHAEAEPVVIDVISKQFAFEMSQTEVKVGQPVLFRVMSADVNHGFGIYDENLVMLAQTQAMPNYVNELAYTFDKPGTYQILCLEYCGIAHHVMINEIVITE